MTTPNFDAPCTSDLSLQFSISTVCELLDKDRERIPTNEQIKAFLEKIPSHASICKKTGQLSLSIQEIKNALADSTCPEWYRERLSSPAAILTIMKLFGSPHFRVQSEDFCLIAVTIHNCLIERWKLIAFAKDNCTMIRSIDFSQYITQWIREKTNFTEDELEYATCLYEHKFSFFIDPMLLKVYPVKDILSSGFYQEMTNALNTDDIDNWFSRKNFDYVLATYKQLDLDCNGLISASELMTFSEFNPEFIGRVFAQTNVYDANGEMDFGGFCDFILAFQHADTMAAWRYFFNIFDSDGDGFISLSDVRALVCSLIDRLQAMNRADIFTMPDVDDLLTYEFWDVIGCANKEKISFRDICNSTMGTTFFRVLTDVDQFLKYDERETQPQDDPAGPIEDRCYP
ncbi:unnamed protein product, partial [Mesorhabditis belari]|uniref:EF-hand domain-containing protein n=1 Tax=Mesorhabditis belari TaxID=2138241 RepID=A0AAF3J5K9_9BILA